ncbi:fused MFS/spermidine synthase [Roseicitreum antarcticum]|uniref:Predicted spermidine synthase with an N-terminal membrane domain n=1 Tax=Roseicitreum antarcticum TaxID=564137 RepID=A0A1H2U5W1_9RHOB|nr:fused MFS/spermidine synthase [Roseicitreum antarcticum]SDW51622.1 Predicted spermidine synthase with an N-terminal membrane domain [Roseicitreum antarcticum]
MRFWTTISLILVLSAVGLTYEIAAGRVLAPFFGTSLLTWTAVIATILAGFSLGSALGGLVAERERRGAIATVRAALIATAVLMALSPTALGLIYALGARETAGMLLAVFVAFFPASVLVTLPSPFLARMAVEARPGREGSSLGLVLSAGSLGAIVGAILAGFVALPLFGSAATFAGCGAAALLCIPLVREKTHGSGGKGRSTESGSKVLIGAAALVVVASVAGRSVCRYESGLSCIDVVRQGSAVQLYSDRTQQAAERSIQKEGQGEMSQGLVLPYTQWLWARMDRDLGPAPSVLFIGGGGYTLLTMLLTERPSAQAVAVEIDPLITDVVREHMPWAGAMIEQTGYDAGLDSAGDTEGEGRLGIIHADGRVFLNQTDRRFDAVVMDAFSSGSVPAHLATRETYEHLRTIVDGPVYVNLIDTPNGPLARGIHAILVDLYPYVELAEGRVSQSGRANIVLAASLEPLAPLDALPSGYEAAQLAPGRAFTDDRGWVGHR